MTASLQIKNNKYYVVVQWKPEGGKRKQKWIGTKLTVDGNNKRKAEQMRLEILNEYREKIALNDNDMLFSDYLIKWLEETKTNISENTYFSYRQTITNSICPYFKERKIKLCDLRGYQIQGFYNAELNRGVSANTIHHYHANIHKALKHAVKTERLRVNPADKVDLPKKEKHIANFYNLEELKELLNKSKGTQLEPVINLAVWFGLRRGEIIGLKWEHIDFERKILIVAGTVTDKGASGSRIENLKYRASAKTISSIRSFALTDDMVNYFKTLRANQLRRQNQPNYNKQWVDFVCVRDNGDLVPLDYVTRAFPRFLKQNGLKPIKLHELRHSNISLLLESGASMKEVQEWAGHSTYQTTANIYAHLQAKNKAKLSNTISNLLSS